MYYFFHSLRPTICSFIYFFMFMLLECYSAVGISRTLHFCLISLHCCFFLSSVVSCSSSNFYTLLPQCIIVIIMICSVSDCIYVNVFVIQNSVQWTSLWYSQGTDHNPMKYSMFFLFIFFLQLRCSSVVYFLLHVKRSRVIGGERDTRLIMVCTVEQQLTRSGGKKM